MNTIDLTPATTTLARLVGATTDEQLASPTPCPDYTVGDLIDHIGGLSVAFTGAARKEAVPAASADSGGSGDASRLEPGWRERIARDLDELARAWSDPAAYDGDTMAGPLEMPGPVAASVALNEVVVHGWDLATALGEPFEAADATVAACLDFAEPFSGPDSAEMRDDAFGPVLDVPADAPAFDRLLGLMGRRPGPL